MVFASGLRPQILFVQQALYTASTVYPCAHICSMLGNLMCVRAYVCMYVCVGGERGGCRPFDGRRSQSHPLLIVCSLGVYTFSSLSLT